MTKAEELIISTLKHADPKLLFKAPKDWFDTDEISKLKFVTDYYKEHHELVGLRSFTSKYKLDPDAVDSRPGLYYRALKDRFVFSELSDNIPGLLKKLKADPRGVLKELSVIVSRLGGDEEHSRDAYYTDDVLKRLADYELRAKTKGVSYMSTGNKILDELFYGYRKGDLITIGGRAGSRKTWLLCFLALLAEKVLPPELNDIMIITNEVPIVEMMERLDAILFMLPYGRFLSGALTPGELKRYKRGIAEITKRRILFVENCRTIEETAHKIHIYKPSALFIDGSYLMEMGYKGQEWEKITYVTRSLKQLGQDNEIPILNTTQLKRGAGKSEKGTALDGQDDFAYSNSYVQDSDIAIRNFTTKEMLLRQEVGMQIAKSRRSDSEIVPIFLSNMNTMEFDFYLNDEDDMDEPDELLL